MKSKLKKVLSVLLCGVILLALHPGTVLGINDGNRTLFILSIACEGNGSVVGSPAGNYDEDDVITLTACPDEHYEFVGWYQNALPFSSAQTLSGKAKDILPHAGSTTNIPVSLTAKFVSCNHNSHPIALCPSGYYADDDFHWTKACAGCNAALDPVAHVDANSNGICDTCHYAIARKQFLDPGNSYSLNISALPAEGGVVTAAVETYGIEDSASVSASAANGYVFAGWFSYVKKNDTKSLGSRLSTDAAFAFYPSLLDTYFVQTTIASLIPNTPDQHDITLYIAAVFDTEEQHAANEVARKIDAIAPVENTAACGERIDDAEAAYNALTPAQKAQLSADVLATLTKAKADYQALTTVFFTVGFDMNGHGTQVDAQTVKEGEYASRPADPSADGYSFEGWYADPALSARFDFNQAITENTTVYGKWAANSVTPGNQDIPETGDNGNLLLWVLLWAVGMAGVALIGRKRSRSN